MIHLMNARVMPQPGRYECYRVMEDEFAERVRRLTEFESWIGYEQTASWIEQLTGRAVPLNRGIVALKDDDTMLVCSLAYRVDPRTKGGFQREDWEYYIVRYNEPKVPRSFENAG